MQGRAPNRFHAFALASIDGVEVDGEGLQLRLKNKPFHKLAGAALVRADAGMPSNKGDVTTLGQVAGLVGRVKAGA